jgi:succinyl-CoA synthetase beta subunit
MSGSQGATERWLRSLRVPFKPDELESKQLLAGYGIAVPEGRRLGTGDSLDPLPGAETGLWILKVCSAEILHKTEAGGVRTNLGRHDLPVVLESLRSRFPGTDLLVEEQVRYTGPELILGALQDTALGPAVMVGAGGVLTELYRDVSFRLAPCPPEECRRMLGELTISPVLQGYRGIDLDTDALAETVNRVGRIAVDLGSRFQQLDVNPVVYSGNRWIALDAKIVLGEERGI